MSWTKRQLVSEAFAELALAGYVFDIAPEEEQAALRRLDTLMATWSGQGVQVGYAIGLTPQSSNIDDDSGLPLVAVEAVYMALAVRIAAGKGKVLAPSTKQNAKQAYDTLVSWLASSQVQRQQMRSGTPKGAGSRPRLVPNQPFLTNPETGAVQLAGDGGLEFTGS